MAFILPVAGLWGCSEPPGPLDVVQIVFSALNKHDVESLAEVTCAEFAPDVEAGAEDAKAAKSKGLALDFSRVEVTVVEQTETECVLRLAGEVNVSGRVEPMDEQLTLVNEDGEWKLCERFF